MFPIKMRYPSFLKLITDFHIILSIIICIQNTTLQFISDNKIFTEQNRSEMRKEMGNDDEYFQLLHIGFVKASGTFL